MKEAKKGICRKCKFYFYVHDHHILSKAKFGKDGEAIKLCPNCHTHFHEYSKKHTTDAYDEKEARKIWNRWYKSVAVVVSMVVIGLMVYLF